MQCNPRAPYAMTTVDLLQRYSFHDHPIHNGRVSHKTKAFNSENPDPTIPGSNPSQYFDAKTKLLHDMLDKVVKDLANNQSEPASEYEGTLWKSPLQPRSRSPTCSEISDSFESPGRIEHCTKELLSTPMSPTSAQFKGPDGWPLGVEVAMNDFHSGKLSTPVLQEEELPNRLIVRKQQHQNPGLGSNVPFERKCDGQHQQESMDLTTLAHLQPQRNVICRQYFEGQNHIDCASLKPLASQQQSSSRLRQQSDCRWQQENVKNGLGEMQEQSDGEYRLDVLCIPTLSARKFGDENSQRNHASTDLDLDLENTHLEKFSDFQPCCEALDDSHAQIDGISSIYENSWPPVLTNSLPCNNETHENAHKLVAPNNALTNALDERIDSPKVLGAFEGIGVESIDPALGCQNTFENIGNDTFRDNGPLLTSEDSKANTDSDIVAWKTLGLLDIILEESEDAQTIPLTLDRGQPQHITLRTADLQKSGGADDRRDGMLAPEEPSAKPSRCRLLDEKSFESLLSAPTIAEFQDLILNEGHLSAATLAALRKIAESQPHFQIWPDLSEDRSQAEIHPVLRSKSFSRPFYQPSTTTNNSALKYTFKDDDSEDHTAGGDSVSHQINMKPFFQAEAQDNDGFVIHTSMKEHPSPQLGKMMQDTVLRCKEDATEGREAECAGTSTPQSMLVPSLENANLSSSSMSSTSSSSMDRHSVSAAGSPDVMPSSIFEPSIWPANTMYYSNSTIASPAPYNSWASDPDHHSLGSSWSTPCSGSTVPTSAIPTPNTTLYDNVSTSPGMKMTPSSSFGQCIENSPSDCGIPMTPSSSFGDFTGNKPSRRSLSVSSMLARYHKARYPDLPRAAMTDSIVPSKPFAERFQAREFTNDPFTSIRNSTTQFPLALKAPRKEDLVDILDLDVGKFNTPTKRSSGRFSMRRRSLSTSGRPNTSEGIENVLSSLVFNPHRSRHLKRRYSTSASIESVAKPEAGDVGHRRSLSIASNTVEQMWEVAPPPTPLDLRDEFSMRYRPEALEADDHYFSRKDALQGMKQGWKKVFGHK